MDYNRELSLELSEICRQHINLDKDSKGDCIKDYTMVVSNIMKELQKSDVLFNKLYTEIYFTGSYYDGLRVSEASEFDLDVILKLPMNADNDIKVDIKGVPAGYAKVNVLTGIQKLRQHPKWTEDYRNLDKWITKDGFIEEENVRNWFESILTKCLNNKENFKWKDDKGHFYKVVLKKSGPAMTLQIKRSTGVPLDVDLVPVIRFDGPNKWPNLPGRKCTYNDKSYFVVPKKKPDATKSYWRLAFPKQEKEIFYNKANLKTTLKIFKKLRDMERWTFLSSYYIKTIFLWEVEKQNYSSPFWNQSLGYLFLHMINRLHECLKLKRIEFFWHSKCNLLDPTKSSGAIENAYYRVNKIIVALNKEPKDVTFLRNYLVSNEDLARRKNCGDFELVRDEDVEGFIQSQHNLVTVPAEKSTTGCWIS